MVTIYVDDIIVIGDLQDEVHNLKSHLHCVFRIKDLGLFHHFSGIEVGYVPDGIIFSQRKFANELLEFSGFSLSKPALIPLTLNTRLSNDVGDILPNIEHYRSLVGKLNYLTNTRPDVSFIVQTLSQFLQYPRTTHLDALLGRIHTLINIV